MEGRPVQRQVYLDWLRVLGVLAVFLYHSTRFFNLDDWHVKNPITYDWLEIWNQFAILWLMPLLFVVSGISLYYATGKGQPARLVKDKLLRLVVPLLVGIFTHCALQVYLERLTHGQFSGTFFQFLPLYFTGHYEGGNPAAGNFAQTGMHLWYLAWLFAFTMVLYPIMLWFHGRGRRLLDRLGDFFSLPGAMYLLALPLMLMAFDNEDSPFLLWWEAGWSLLVYACLIAIGFLLGSRERLLDNARRLRWVSLALAVVSTVAAAGIGLIGEEPAFGSARYISAVALRGLSAWCWVLAFIGLGRAYLTRSTPFLRYANQGVLPFYIMHQTVLLGIGYLVVQWSIPSLLKWAILFAVSFALIVAVYDLLVRRFNLLRVLFGLKWQPKAPARLAAPAVPQGAGR